MTIEEFRDVFLKHRKPNLELIKERLKGLYVVYSYRSAIRVIYGKQATIFEKKYLIDDMLLKRKELKGRPASLGQATGRVRVIHKWHEMKTFKKGEVLVVNNTNPAFVPYLHKAVAIVAAEGGVTVHAAIVSREMNIPCVIGVSDVTRLLKTGELVCVYAAKGIVRKL